MKKFSKIAALALALALVLGMSAMASTDAYDVVLTAYEGLAAGGTELTEAQYAGKTVYFNATVTNTSGSAADGTIVIGIYNGETLVKYAAMSNSFDVAGTKTFGAAFKLEAGQTARAWVK